MYAFRLDAEFMIARFAYLECDPDCFAEEVDITILFSTVSDQNKDLESEASFEIRQKMFQLFCLLGP